MPDGEETEVKEETEYDDWLVWTLTENQERNG